MQNPLHTTCFSFIVKSESLDPQILLPSTSPPLPRAAAALQEQKRSSPVLLNHTVSFC